MSHIGNWICKYQYNDEMKNTRRVGDNQFPLDQICLGVNNTNQIKLEWYTAHFEYALWGGICDWEKTALFMYSTMWKIRNLMNSCDMLVSILIKT